MTAYGYGYVIYQAERVKSEAEQRRADAELGARVAVAARHRRSLAGPLGAWLRGAWLRGTWLRGAWLRGAWHRGAWHRGAGQAPAPVRTTAPVDCCSGPRGCDCQPGQAA